MAARWKQWRFYFTDVHPGGMGPQRQPGMGSSSAPLAGYPRVFNIEMDPHEDLMVAGLFGWTLGPAAGGGQEVHGVAQEVSRIRPRPTSLNFVVMTADLQELTMRSSRLFRECGLNAQAASVTLVLAATFFLPWASARADEGGVPFWFSGAIREPRSGAASAGLVADRNAVLLRWQCGQIEDLPEE